MEMAIYRKTGPENIKMTMWMHVEYYSLPGGMGVKPVIRKHLIHSKRVDALLLIM